MYLYRFFNRHGRLLYVGITIDPERRTKEHAARAWHATGAWFGEVAAVRMEFFPDERSARAAEMEAIKAEWPLCNIHGNPDTTWRDQSARDAYAATCRAGMDWKRRESLRGAAKAAVERKRERLFREALAMEFYVLRLVRQARVHIMAA